MRVLVAEDSASMRKIVARMLQSMGFKDIRLAADGVQAWEQLSHHKVDLLLTDCNMPRMSGLELARRVRRSYSSTELPIVMFTTRKSREDILAAVRAGVNGYLVKPFNLKQLQVQLDKARGISGTQKAAPAATGGARTSPGAAPAEAGTAEARLVVARNRRPVPTDSGPLVICGERYDTLARLSAPDQRSTTRSLAALVRSMDAINDEFSDLHARFFIEPDSARLARHVRHHRERLKLLVLSNELGGGGATVARLARINQTCPVGVVLVLEALGALRRRERQGLEKVGVLLVERQQLDEDYFGRLLREQVVARVREHTREVPRPEDILERIETDISLLTALPILPMVYHKIIKLARHRYSELAEWSEAVKTDPISSAVIIRRAASPLYGFRQPVSDVDKAVTLLGKSTVKELIVSDALRRSFDSIQEAHFSLDDYWAHSLCTGLVARMLSMPMARNRQDEEQARECAGWGLSTSTVQLLTELEMDQRLPLGEDDDPFVAGMMHDIGKVALAHCYPGMFPLVLAGLKEARWDQPMHVVENEVVGITHAQVGQTLARNWGLADVPRRVIATHHEPEEGDALVSLIHLADALANAVFPYPCSEGHPMIRAIRDGEFQTLNAGGTEEGQQGEEEGTEVLGRFLSGALLEHLQLDRGQFIQLAMVLAPDLQRLVDKVRASMRE